MSLDLTKVASQVSGMIARLKDGREEMQKHLQFALETLQNARGSDHPDVAAFHNHLAKLYQATTEYQKAENHLLKARYIYEKNMGPDHPMTGMVFASLATLYRDMGMEDKATEFQDRADSIIDDQTNRPKLTR